MKVKYFIFYLFFTFLPLCVNAKDHIDTSYLKDEFNISFYWHEGMTWNEFLKIRNNLQREGLVKYVDKIETQKLAQEMGLDTPKTYLASREKEPFVGIISDLSFYVAKMTHLSQSERLIIVKNGVNILTGRPITPEEVQKNVFKSFEVKPRNVESWALHQVKPGFMIQEYIPSRMEVKIQTIWGKGIIGTWRGGKTKNWLPKLLGVYDHNGKKVGRRRHKYRKAPKCWPHAVKAAEKLAKAIGADALRVDFFIKEDGQLLLNELEIWPETIWPSVHGLEARLNDGYRSLCER